ncbi:uncharacterized protein LOC126790721 [Argentina anserina]|uniref:uncharacterized protein LOC126790721 n=1 Tax=Argentina anserina TaxID=57926 RepID=UPI0021766850|nr:uncharacterized protein LOC126790721 [Potentilla anserina]
MAATPPPSSLNFCTLLTETKRIVGAHSRHFLALSLLFLLPIPFSSVLCHSLLSHYPTNSQQFFLTSHSTPLPAMPLLLALAFALFVLLFSLFALASITYSVFHAFYGRPVKFLSAVNSIRVSFWPLLGTALASLLVFSLVLIVAGLFLFLMIGGFEMFGFEMEVVSPYCVGLFIVCLAVAVLYLQLNWTLAGVVAVVEPRWGFDALSRSASLIKGMRGVAVSLIVFFHFFGFCSGMSWWSVYLKREWDVSGNVVQIVCYSMGAMVMLLYHLAANTVLYMYCKAVHGELALEIAEEFASEYVSLPFDDGKVPHVVSVAYVQ